jgi:hypothetical protein
LPSDRFSEDKCHDLSIRIRRGTEEERESEKIRERIGKRRQRKA